MLAIKNIWRRISVPEHISSEASANEVEAGDLRKSRGRSDRAPLATRRQWPSPGTPSAFRDCGLLCKLLVIPLHHLLLFAFVYCLLSSVVDFFNCVSSFVFYNSGF